ncbi:uncharacterized protein LTR77_006330 [Saxophila tyrrhenica]|uniref:Uncharacterized protein n=1 Tax=Saxophila tyrrhenica TaxID=1690608 RepID=A0AAV9P7K7_9PEZI|nr:hypothetical protein LTR77_006330 [Saxophila tyrrhenica]
MITLLIGLLGLAWFFAWLNRSARTSGLEAREGAPPSTTAAADDQQPMPPADQLRNIYHITFLLRQKLVPDVVPAILHHAGLFQRHASSIKNDHPVSITQRNAPYLCLLTPPINSSARLKHPVRKVVFAIQSCDQGWADDRSASWTWFTAGVVHHCERSEETLIDERVVELALEDQSDSDKFLDAERQIMRNIAASREMRTTIIEWTVDSEDENEREWVASLQNGDRIAVRAWAQFQGWKNKIKSVSVATYTAAVV